MKGFKREEKIKSRRRQRGLTCPTTAASNILSTSSRRKRIPRPGVRVEVSRPVLRHQSTVLGDTRKIEATSGTVKRLGIFISVMV